MKGLQNMNEKCIVYGLDYTKRVKSLASLTFVAIKRTKIIAEAGQ